jgi:hypothetical protein
MILYVASYAADMVGVTLSVEFNAGIHG